MDKLSILDKVKAAISEQIEALRENELKAMKDSADLPGAMQSRYDTMGKELAWYAEGLQKRKAELEQTLFAIESMPPAETTDKIAIGSLVRLKDKTAGTERWCYLLPEGGGLTIAEDGVDVRVISRTAPLSRLLLGKAVDSTADLGKGKPTYIIQEIC